MGHAVEPVADRLVELGLTRTENLGHGGHAPLHLGLRPHDFGKTCLCRLGLDGQQPCQFFGRAAPPRRRHRDDERKDEDEKRPRAGQQKGTDGHA